MSATDRLLDPIARGLVGAAPPSDDARLLRRIEELAKNARGTWFGLIGLLVFVGVTLMGVSAVDFYGVERQSQLPLVGVSVPTTQFFWSAPVLTAAVYSYFHLYLIKLWDALGAVGPNPGGEPLAEAVYPWMVADAAINLRTVLRGDRAAPRRALAWISAFLALALAWGFGLVILFFAWWWSMPARDPWMTLFTAGAGLFAGWVGLTSLVVMWRRMAGDFRPGSHRVWNARLWRNAALWIVLAVSLVSIDRTRGVGEFLLGPPEPDGAPRFSLLPLAPISLAGARLAERPGDWLSRATAEKDFRTEWCRREAVPDCSWTSLRDAEFAAEWRERRAGYIAAIPKPNLNGRDLRGADLEGAFLAGVSLRGARLEGADLRGAQLEETRLTAARLQGASMDRAWLGGADLDGAWATGASLKRARLADASLSGARLPGVDLSFADGPAARFDDADLAGAELSSARFPRASFANADLSGAEMQGAQLSSAYLGHARLDGANLPNAKLDFADLIGASLDGANLFNADLREANLQRASLTGANLVAADFTRATLIRARLTNADFREASFEDATLDWTQMPALLHNARLARATGLRLEQLAHAIGSEGTRLPEAPDRTPLSIATCWPEPPENLDAVLAAALLRLPPERHEEFRAEMRRDFLCAAGVRPALICTPGAACGGG